MIATRIPLADAVHPRNPRHLRPSALQTIIEF